MKAWMCDIAGCYKLVIKSDKQPYYCETLFSSLSIAMYQKHKRYNLGNLTNSRKIHPVLVRYFAKFPDNYSKMWYIERSRIYFHEILGK